MQTTAPEGVQETGEGCLSELTREPEITTLAPKEYVIDVELGSDSPRAA